MNNTPIIKHGYYKVNGQIFLKKIPALLHANLTKADVTWHFNNEILDNVDWTVEPTLSLDQLYGLRAKQIREEFDYVILMLSGGSDSTNVFNSFLNNKVHIDEVVASAPLSGLNNWKVDPENKHKTEIVSETFLAQLPLVNQIITRHPNIKVTVNDYFDDLLKLNPDTWVQEQCGHWLHPTGVARHSLMKLTHVRDLAERGKKVAIVYGTDKPLICRNENGDLYTNITDAATTIPTSPFEDAYPNVESELFYYSGSLPELMIKQAHAVCKWLYKPENKYVKNLMWDKSKSWAFNSSGERHGKYERAIVPCIYPSLITTNVYQADKGGSGMIGASEIDHWVYKLHGNNEIIQSIGSAIGRFVDTLDRKYMFSDDRDGFAKYFNSWKIGHESLFSS